MKFLLAVAAAMMIQGLSPAQAQLNSYKNFEISIKKATSYLGLLQDGDLIFHESKSNQAGAIKEATESNVTHVGVLVKDKNKWYVAEASAKVQVTPLQTFIDRGVGKDFVIKRVKPTVLKMNSTHLAKLKKEFKKYQGMAYDIYFQWSDRTIYCSEYTWKSYQRALGIELGKVETWGDLKTDGPLVQRLIKERLDPAGIEFNLKEKIVTPISQFESTNLYTVYQTK